MFRPDVAVQPSLQLVSFTYEAGGYVCCTSASRCGRLGSAVTITYYQAEVRLPGDWGARPVGPGHV